MERATERGVGAKLEVVVRRDGKYISLPLKPLSNFLL